MTLVILAAVDEEIVWICSEIADDFWEFDVDNNGVFLGEPNSIPRKGFGFGFVRLG